MEPVETTQPTAGDKMHEASEVVSAKAGEAVDSGRGLVADQIGQRSTQLSDQIGSASETMRRVAEQARTEGNSQHARLADQAADRGERVKNYLDEVEPEQLLSDVEDFARRQPWVVAGVGLFVEFPVARSLKASSGRVCVALVPVALPGQRRAELDGLARRAARRSRGHGGKHRKGES